ncbi:hypothetical protein TNCV_2377801 [Trichonephila clavipes]|nr:hypothetical protein TNCV_2377801 [Trichonephila clavipes]
MSSNLVPLKIRHVEEVVEAPNVLPLVWCDSLESGMLAEVPSLNLTEVQNSEISGPHSPESVVATVTEWSRYRIVAGLFTSSRPVPLPSTYPRPAL